RSGSVPKKCCRAWIPPAEAPMRTITGSALKSLLSPDLYWSALASLFTALRSLLSPDLSWSALSLLSSATANNSALASSILRFGVNHSNTSSPNSANQIGDSSASFAGVSGASDARRNRCLRQTVEFQRDTFRAENGMANRDIVAIGTSAGGVE